jgi:hypothetical protein
MVEKIELLPLLATAPPPPIVTVNAVFFALDNEEVR